MKRTDPQTESLFDQVRQAQDEALAQSNALSAIRARLPTPPPRRKGAASAARFAIPFRNIRFTVGVGYIYGAVAVAVLMAALGGFAFRLDSHPVPVQAMVAGAARQVGDTVDASPAATTAVTFSDGSTVTLARGSRARLEDLAETGARIRLERGAAEVHVVHRRLTAWSVLAGPFTVRVVGTRFLMEWNDDNRFLDVAVDEGRVIVVGPNQLQRSLGAGERWRFEVERDPSAPRVDVHREPTPHQTLSDESRAPSLAAARVRSQAAPAESTDVDASAAWRLEVREGRYRTAMGLLTDEAFGNLVARGTEEELTMLGTAARRASDGRAFRVYLALRRRYSDRERVHGSAFHLGRLSLHGGDEEGACEWLEVSLQEAPDGVWAQEALGRLLEALHRSGRHARATELAADYLRRYPRGPHGEFARSLAHPP